MENKTPPAEGAGGCDLYGWFEILRRQTLIDRVEGVIDRRSKRTNNPKYNNRDTTTYDHSWQEH